MNQFQIHNLKPTLWTLQPCMLISIHSKFTVLMRVLNYWTKNIDQKCKNTKRSHITLDECSLLTKENRMNWKEIYQIPRFPDISDHGRFRPGHFRPANSDRGRFRPRPIQTVADSDRGRFRPRPIQTAASSDCGRFRPRPIQTAASSDHGQFRPRPVQTAASSDQTI